MIGIDPGTATTGFGIIDEQSDGSLTCIQYGIIQTSPSLTMPERLAQIYEDMQEILLLHQPQFAAVEKLFFQKNVTNAISVGQARGVVLLSLQQQHIPIREFTPNEVKQAVSGYGAAGKKQVQAMVRTILNLNEIPEPDDAADALAVAICYQQTKHLQDLIED
ncbi:MAG: crossover junction endodeoxyribonuclease RuvC [Anaerolineaceae bacterium]|nr:crossover junction endodeoxyribonuclease RuvC [Anaerolineaceae bacterium]